MLVFDWHLNMLLVHIITSVGIWWMSKWCKKHLFRCWFINASISQTDVTPLVYWIKCLLSVSSNLSTCSLDTTHIDLDITAFVLMSRCCYRIFIIVVVRDDVFDWAENDDDCGCSALFLLRASLTGIQLYCSIGHLSVRRRELMFARRQCWRHSQSDLCRRYSHILLSIVERNVHWFRLIAPKTGIQ
jgi:hypothetical protein